MHDAIEGERLGIPSVGIMTDRFITSAKLVAELNGLKGYPFSVIPHPIANNDDEALKAKAILAVGEIVTMLTRRPA